jgi:hypothetical protein
MKTIVPLSIEKCRKILEQGGKKYLDDEILKIRKLLYNLADLEYMLYLDLKRRQNG